MNDSNAPAIWEAALGQLQVSVNKPNYDTWLRDTIGLCFNGETFVVGANSDFKTEWLDVRMRKVVLQALARVIGRAVAVSFEVIRTQDEPDLLAHTDALPALDGKDAVPARPSRVPALHPALTFDTFVVGEENELAHAAAQAVVGAPGRQSPLVIFGGPGLGKTHLLNAIGHAAHAAGLNVVYATAERFGTEFGAAAQHKSFDAFRRRYRTCDVLLIDDVQFFETRPGFQEEFFHTFNDLHAAGKQVVVTCDRLPSRLAGLTEALRTRLMMGLQADLQRPSFATRLAILRAKARHCALRLPDAALEQIAQRCCPTVRELEGYLNRVLAHIPLVGGQATPDIIERALAVFTTPAAGAQADGAPLPSADDVIAAVCARTTITRADLAGRSRSRDVSYARHLAMYVLRHDARKTVAEIQRLFGNRDHSTVIGAIDRIEGELATRPETRDDLASIRESLAAPPAAAPPTQAMAPRLTAV
jgi:chromosomal replication initiator protein